MKRKHKWFVIGLAIIVGGGLMIKYVEPTSGAALVAAGGWLIGKLQRELFPDATPHPQAFPPVKPE